MDELDDFGSGAILGFFSVSFGAYSEHSLREIVIEEHFRQIMTGIRNNQGQNFPNERT